jgi:hypothetical protein
MSNHDQLAKTTKQLFKKPNNNPAPGKLSIFIIYIICRIWVLVRIETKSVAEASCE